MISIKKALLTVGLVLGLTACGSDKEDSKFYLATADKLSSLEHNMLDIYYENYPSDGYNEVLEEILIKRQSLTNPLNNSVPFCDVVEFLTQEDENRDSSKKGFSLTKQWLLKNGRTLTDSCNRQIELAKVAMEVEVEPESDQYILAKQYLTSDEINMLDHYYEHQANTGYDEILNILINKRVNSPYNRTTPFCDIAYSLSLIETNERQSVRKGNSLGKQWEKINNEPLSLSCSKEQSNLIKNGQSTIANEIQDQTLTSDEILELSKLTKTCFSAKVKLNVLMSGQLMFSKNDIVKIKQVKSDCAMAALVKELNAQ